ncbi:MAG: hypothetical protein Q8P48_05105, partial [Deltaproteobacteria bacterium]|nr:hypothetical protein [Deltaproteobacteria bacterium]
SVNKGGKVRQGTNVFDYEKNVRVSRSWGGGKEEKSGEYPFPDDITPYDPIAAFYNFRFGAYGPIEKGGKYVIHSFPKEDRVPLITIRIAPDDEARGRAGSYSGKTEYLADARIDKELFDSKSGDVEIYFDNGMIPVGAVAKDLLFLGDVRGHLTRSKLPGEKKVAYKISPASMEGGRGLREGEGFLRPLPPP